MAHELPALPYAHDALEPFIDTMTMQIHHGKHHATYVTNLNAALEQFPDFQKHSVDDLIRNIANVPEAIRTAVRNNGGGHANHAMFWQIMAPKAGGDPSGPLADAIKASFGSFEAFKGDFKKAALGRFGSGWAWLVNTGGKLTIESTPNQDSPVMEGRQVVMGVDVWEHAYYLKYQNRRADYVDAWWSVVNWTEIAKRFVR
ncbi:MAG: superoxide dismutase [Vicinamibacterales bacterium]|jgi:Fe-Mn family superoxide dismutase|nr:superoxide dismutase [Vicinamibacterales bacterium]